MQHINTQGIVLKRTFVGEKDAIIKILTLDKGLISASAKGIKNMKSKLSAGSSVFSFSEFSISEDKGRCIVSSAVLKEGFYGLSSNIERLSYAAYFADLVAMLNPTSDDAKNIISLILNTFYLLSNTDKNMNLIKCVFELKLLSALGYAPELEGCVSCGEAENLVFFSASEGGVCCKSCAPKDVSIITKDTLSAMRYTQHADCKKAFSFTLSPDGLSEFNRCTEKMCEQILGKAPASLTYLKQITGKI